MISGPQRKFCEGIVEGKTGVDAYRAAYPRSAASTARRAASALRAKREIKAEIERLRAKADTLAGSAVLMLMEKRIRIVRASPATLARESDLWQSIKETEAGTEFRMPDKLAAIKLDNDLAGEGSEAESQDALGELLARCMK
jgi:phage terminase small subunit